MNYLRKVYIFSRQKDLTRLSRYPKRRGYTRLCDRKRGRDGWRCEGDLLTAGGGGGVEEFFTKKRKWWLEEGEEEEEEKR